MRKIFILLLLVSMVSCVFHQETYYVDSCNITISIDKIEDDLYRVYLDTGQHISGRNYIDFHYPTEGMSSIALYFPFEKSNMNSMDTVYVADKQCLISQCKSEYSKIIVTTFGNPISSGKSTESDHEWSDSTLFRVPCIEVRLNAYLDGITVLGNDGENYVITKDPPSSIGNEYQEIYIDDTTRARQVSFDSDD